MATLTQPARESKAARLETIGQPRNPAGQYVHPESPDAIVRVVLPNLNIGFRCGNLIFATWEAACRYAANRKAAWDACHGTPAAPTPSAQPAAPEPASEAPAAAQPAASVPPPRKADRPRVVRLRFAARRASLLAERAKRRAYDATAARNHNRYIGWEGPDDFDRQVRAGELARAAERREDRLWAALDREVAGRLATQHAAAAAV